MSAPIIHPQAPTPITDEQTNAVVNPLADFAKGIAGLTTKVGKGIAEGAAADIKAAGTLAQKGATAVGGKIQAAGSAVAGRVQEAGLDPESMVATGFDNNALMNMIAGMTMDAGRSAVSGVKNLWGKMTGGGEGGEEGEEGEGGEGASEEIKVSKEEGAGVEISQQTSIFDDLLFDTGVIKDLLSHIAIDTEGLINLNTELLGVWVDQAAMERIMHEETMAQSAADRLSAIEERRESGRVVKAEPGGVPMSEEDDEEGGGALGKMFGGITKFFKGKWMTSLFGILGSVFTGLMTMAKALPRLVKSALPWIKTGGKFFLNIFKKLFFPVTALFAIFDFVTGFIDEYKETGSIVEGIKGGFESMIHGLIDVPLNMLKDAVSWILSAVGLDEEAAALDSFEFDIAGIWRTMADTITGWLGSLFDSLMNLPSLVKDFAIDVISAIPGGGKLMDYFFGGDEEVDTGRQAEAAAMLGDSDSASREQWQDPEGKGSIGGGEKIKRGYTDDAVKHIASEYGADELKSFGYGYDELKAMGMAEYQIEKIIGMKKGDKATGELMEIMSSDDASAMLDFDEPTGLNRPPTAAGQSSKLRRSSTEIQPAPDSRAAAATAVQTAGIEKGAGAGEAGPVTINAPQDNSSTSTGGQAIPIPIDMNTDPSLTQPSNL